MSIQDTDEIGKSNMYVQTTLKLVEDMEKTTISRSGYVSSTDDKGPLYSFVLHLKAFKGNIS